MKVLKKKNKYEKVSPLPKGWVSLNLANKQKDTNNKYSDSYARLTSLLENSWSFSNRESYRKALKKKEGQVSNKKPKNKKNKK